MSLKRPLAAGFLAAFLALTGFPAQEEGLTIEKAVEIALAAIRRSSRRPPSSTPPAAGRSRRRSSFCASPTTRAR